MKDYESIARKVCELINGKYSHKSVGNAQKWVTDLEIIESALRSTAEPLEKRINALEARITHFVEVDEKELSKTLEEWREQSAKYQELLGDAQSRIRELEEALKTCLLMFDPFEVDTTFIEQVLSESRPTNQKEEV
jgi:predicted RNase H-like nuclease (RuvC/YqgF family)